MTQRAEERRPMDLRNSSLQHLAYSGILRYMVPGIAKDLDLSAVESSPSPQTYTAVRPETRRLLDELHAKDTEPKDLDDLLVLGGTQGAEIAETPAEQTFFAAKPEIALLFQLTGSKGLRYISRQFSVLQSAVEVVDAQQRIYRVNPHLYSDRNLKNLYRNATFALELPRETGRITAERVKDGTMVYIERPGRFSGLRVTADILAVIPSGTNGDTAAFTSAISRALSPVAVHLRNGEKPVLLYRHLGDSESDASGDATGAPYQQALARYQDQISVLPTAMFGPKGVSYQHALKTWTANPVERV